jgi:hypothetical protein
MKKLLILNIALFYLLSGVGYASVQHYCITMQKAMQTLHEECCCSAEEENQAQDACALPQDSSEQPSCCANKAERSENPDLQINVAHLQDVCCETALDYNSIDTATVTKSIDVAPTVECSGQIAAFSVDTEPRHAIQSVAEAKHPSFHCNLPLII